MLILTRKIDQSVNVYDAEHNLVGFVMVLGVERDRVKLGFNFLEEITVLRGELTTDETGPKSEPLTRTERRQI